MKILLFCKNIEANKKALKIAVEQAQAFKASVCLVSCIEQEPEVPTDITEEMMKKASERLRDHAAEFLQPAGIDCTMEVMVSTGHCGEKIVQYARNKAIDLIIMAIRQRSKVGKVFFGSTSQQIILEAPCMVLTIK